MIEVQGHLKEVHNHGNPFVLIFSSFFAVREHFQVEVRSRIRYYWDISYTPLGIKLRLNLLASLMENESLHLRPLKPITYRTSRYLQLHIELTGVVCDKQDQGVVTTHHSIWYWRPMEIARAAKVWWVDLEAIAEADHSYRIRSRYSEEHYFLDVLSPGGP
jgi:hypothetical protein